MKHEVGVLFVCLGNICRSPTAEGVFRERLRRAGLERRVLVDSAGTGGWHVGEPPDPRTRAAAARRGYDLSALRARQVARDDFRRFDLVLAMDLDNRTSLLRQCPATEQGRIGLFLSYLPDARATEVPDPYDGGVDGFEHVLDLVEAASDGLLESLRRRLDA